MESQDHPKTRCRQACFQKCPAGKANNLAGALNAQALLRGLEAGR